MLPGGSRRWRRGLSATKQREGDFNQSVRQAGYAGVKETAETRHCPDIMVMVWERRTLDLDEEGRGSMRDLAAGAAVVFQDRELVAKRNYKCAGRRLIAVLKHI